MVPLWYQFNFDKTIIILHAVPIYQLNLISVKRQRRLTVRIKHCILEAMLSTRLLLIKTMQLTKPRSGLESCISKDKSVYLDIKHMVAEILAAALQLVIACSSN